MGQVTDDSALRQRLEELHRELELTETVDAGSRELLHEVLRDMTELLERSGETQHTHQSLAQRLALAARDFEESHPKLFATVGRVVDTLANLGI
jgi:hypothetical protein